MAKKKRKNGNGNGNEGESSAPAPDPRANVLLVKHLQGPKIEQESEFDVSTDLDVDYLQQQIRLQKLGPPREVPEDDMDTWKELGFFQDQPE